MRKDAKENRQRIEEIAHKLLMKKALKTLV